MKWLLVFLVCAGALTAHGQPVPPSSPSAEAARNVETMESLLAPLRGAETDLQALQQDLAAATGNDAKAEIQKRINEMRERVSQMRDNLRTVATGVQEQTYFDKSEAAAPVDQEIKSLLQPLLQEIRQATAAPRAREELRDALARWQERRGIAETALSRIDAELAATANPELEKELVSSRKLWEGRLGEAMSEIGVLTSRMEDMDRNSPTFFQSISKGFASFWKSRGLNLLLAGVTFMVILLITRRIYQAVKRVSRLSRQKNSLILRAADLAAAAVCILLAIIGALIVLYVKGDWLLLTIAAIILIGLVLASRNALPPYINQIKILLNIGPVRQGERLVYEGVPWKLEKLGFYCEFVNPELTGGMLRLPVASLQELHSRPADEKEPWFPTHQDDWVILSDSTYGKVVMQTPEQVVVLRLGGSRKTYPIPDFLEKCPENLSRGFRISVTFGIDYQHQEIATVEVPSIFLKKLEPVLTATVEREHLRSIKVEFASAGASSLDYAVLADFTGDVASRMNVLERLIHRTCVDVCNEQKWTIPFTQITVHQAQDAALSS